MPLYMSLTGRRSAGTAEEFFTMLGFQGKKRVVLRIAALTAVAMTAGACSSLPSVPDWVDPTSWFGDDSSSTADTNAQTPDLASIPDRPTASTPDDQKQVAESLAADRQHAQYSADALKGGTEAAAAPPPNLAPSDVASSENLPGSAADQASRGRGGQSAATAPASALSAVPVQTAQVDRSVTPAPTGAAMPGTLPPPPAGVAANAPAPDVQPAPSAAPMPSPGPQEAENETPTAPVTPPTTAAQPAPVRTASLEHTAPQPARVRHHRARTASTYHHAARRPVASAQVAPAQPEQQMAAVDPSDAALGFEPSKAPPLDPSVSQFVAQPILQRYEQTAAAAHMYSSGVSVAAAQPRAHRHHHRAARSDVAMGGPEHMSGAVVANMEALNSTEAAPAAMPAAYADAQGLPASAVVFFPGDITSLSARARAEIRTAAEQYRAQGGNGYVRVVGHSSSRTPNMSAAEHQKIVFEKSQERADAVAQELIRDGVPAAKVLVEAVGDSQPVYYESMPKGEDGNRRTEIFLQG
ncbi:MAG: OmpA family protein [Alphaproteobacteria bacterium]|nr:OmpA family protein [Alphaproteobacteria bacterium]